MRAHTLIGVVLLAAGLGSATLTAGGHGHGAARQWAVVYLAEPTLIGSTFVQGPVLFTHDAQKMARGEPCTSVQLFEPHRGPFEEVAAFHCIPRAGKVSTRFLLTTRAGASPGFGCVLTAYQFAGDPEVHGVPIVAEAH